MTTINELKMREEVRRSVLDWMIAKGFTGDVGATFKHLQSALPAMEVDMGCMDEMSELGLVKRFPVRVSSTTYNTYAVTDAGLEVMGVDADEYRIMQIEREADEIEAEINSLESEIDELEERKSELLARQSKLERSQD